MRIGLFTDSYCPQVNGVATSVLMLKENLELLGHTVFVFTTSDPSAREGESGVYRIPSVRAVAGRRLAYPPPGVMKTVASLRLDIVHTHTEFTLGLLGRKAARKNNIPLVHTMHTIYEYYTHYIPGTRQLDTLKKGMVKKLCAAWCNSADRVIVPTRKVEQLLSSYGVVRETCVVATGIDIGKFRGEPGLADAAEALRRDLWIREDDKVIVSIGRVSKEKNIEELLLAMKTYLPLRPDVRFLIVGDGPAKKHLEGMSRDLGLSERVTFLGEQPWEGIAAFYRLGHVFISASRSETQGLTYIEALAAGLPVVAKADPCLDGTLLNGVNGYTFTDSGGMERALDNLLYDCARYREFSNQAALSAGKFSAEHFARAVQSVYLEALADGADLPEELTV
ncbi:MAG: glycosyltransferase family 4 protein [Oscillospiraceae bacterium]|nr:glycosyltransferase family 4 protein [Oscillospiraceae bacterium]